MKRQKLIIIILIAVLFFTGIASLFSSYYLVKQVRVVNIEFEVDNSLGFNSDPSEHLNFGIIKPSGVAYKTVNLNNSGERVKVQISVKGDISDWIAVSESDFYLEKGEYKELLYSVSIPDDASPGKYDARSVILFKRIF